ncbi:GTPase HflX [Paenibacillus sp. IB182496]|uniref:GTPase HflX n=1 Tax=Paenibacillus sabuli TaxID=2772509 RepID=A0A927GU47_9BACL|nr:GTPase HflX [Paenibacillus sabuli]MBD2847981.1 GTPase HflX [Paenibacillus sabuli]
MRPTTYRIETEQQETAMLVSVVTPEQTRGGINPEHSLQELMRLAETAGVTVAGTLVQQREAPDTRWLIGKGKVDELRQLAAATDSTTAIFDQELSVAQVRNLEQALDLKIIDRTQLILDIFAQRARTREGIIQVELAQLSYLLPRLSGHGKHLSRLGGGIGTRGPGETKLETDRRHIRGRISELKRQLSEVARHRQLLRERRHKTGVRQVALVGYTNAGKSTLLRQFTEADVYVENQLFATLDPTTRALKLAGGKEIVLTDTVGFIQNLPHDLVAAFRATLEEVCEADLVLHVVDSSSAAREEQAAVVQQILTELGAGDKPQLTVYNKKDLCSGEQAERVPTGKDALWISAYDAVDLETLRRHIQERLSGRRERFALPAARGDLIALAHRMGEVIEQTADGETLRFTVELDPSEYEQHGGPLRVYKEADAPYQ